MTRRHTYRPKSETKEHGAIGPEHQEPLYDVDVPTPSHAERARTLVAAARTGTLSTAAQELDGHPYGSFVTFGLTEEGDPVLLISALAEHTKNLRRDRRASLLVAEAGQVGDDPLALGRVTLVAHAEALEPKSEEADLARGAFLKTHPGAAYYVDFRDFSFWHLGVESIRYIGGYGRMSWVEAEAWRAARPDPLLPHARDIVEHMNQDHAETMALYCRAFTRAKAAKTGDVKMVGVDRYGFELSVGTPWGPRPVRLAYPEEAATPNACRQALIALADEARERLA